MARSTPWLWEALHDLFDTDDGSLPEVHVHYRDQRATVAGYALLRQRAASIVPEKLCLWSKVDNAERELYSATNAADPVVSAEAHPFHVVLGGIRARSTPIPDLGVFVFPRRLALDDRMGAARAAGEIEALFEILVELTALDPHASLSREEGVLPEVVARFQKAWHRWVSDHAA